MLGDERGQTIPFWTVATAAVLTMMLFVLNYAASITWNVRAQDAADSAAGGGLSVAANVLNEETTILYAAAVDEYRLRSLNQALLNVIDHNGGCSATVGGTCEQDYAVLLNAYNTALAAYDNDHQLLQRANNLQQGGQQQAERRAAALAAGGACGSSSDPSCNFAYTTVADGSSGGATEVVACHNVPYVGTGLLGTSAPSFQAVAHGASVVAPASTETFYPASINPQTGLAYQPNETSWYGQMLPYVSPAYAVSFGTPSAPTLGVMLNWYAAIAVRPTTSVPSGSYTCQ